MTEQKTCAERIEENYNSRIETIRRLWTLSQQDPEAYDDLCEYGLSFDYVEPNTFKDQPFGFWRWQLSYGGPSDEFRLYGGGRVEYVFLDWFDGAKKELEGEDLEMLQEIFSCFLECVADRYGF